MPSLYCASLFPPSARGSKIFIPLSNCQKLQITYVLSETAAFALDGTKKSHRSLLCDQVELDQNAIVASQNNWQMQFLTTELRSTCARPVIISAVAEGPYATS